MAVYNGPDTSDTVQSVSGTIKYRVRACNVGGCGPVSNVRTVTVYTPPDPCPPGEICFDPRSVEVVPAEG